VASDFAAHLIDIDRNLFEPKFPSGLPGYLLSVVISHHDGQHIGAQHQRNEH
jgi:hypothetical protein